MKFVHHALTLPRLSIAVCSLSLAACGAGGSQNAASTTETAATLSSSAQSSTLRSLLNGPITTTVPPTTPPSTSTPASTGATVTDIGFQNLSSTTAQQDVPVTFGQVFAQGDLKAGEILSGRLSNGATIPLQVNIKATHADGSIRHAIISAVIPSIAASSTATMALVKGGSAPSGTVSLDTFLRSGFSASAHAKIGGVDYYATAEDLLKSGKSVAWLSGPIATEWEVDAPLRTASGIQHPHLTAHFAIRWYPGANKTRVDVVVENNWAYEAAPQNFTFDASVLVNGKSVYSKPGLIQYHHSRWRKLFWADGNEPQVNVQHNTAYLIKSRAVANYDQNIKVPEAALAQMQTSWTGAITEPGGVGMANPYMPSTGGRNDIGLLPGWTVEYLLSMDKRAKMVTLGTADLSGSWSSHFRDKQTGLPVSVIDYPYMTILGRAGDAYNRTLKRSEAFPACAGTNLCKSVNSHDSAHQPNLVYLPYLVTGDYYYLEELQFWAMWNVFSDNPYYREFEKGLVQPDQVRGQAWSMRTLAEAAYITPDSHPLKTHFAKVLDANLDWYNTTYVSGTKTSNALGTNALGIITNGYSLVYNNATGVGPWQDDFFTQAIGHVADLGFTKADTLLRWKAKFPISRMVGSGACWIGGAIYTLTVRDSNTSPIYSTIGEAFKKSSPNYTSTACGSAEMASALKLKVGEMSGYSDTAIGYPSNMQPALAYAADVGGTDGKSAWAKFAGRSVKPDYSKAPQFAIVPR
jgi:hypothetical protein